MLNSLNLGENLNNSHVANLQIPISIDQLVSCLGETWQNIGGSSKKSALSRAKKSAGEQNITLDHNLMKMLQNIARSILKCKNELGTKIDNLETKINNPWYIKTKAQPCQESNDVEMIEDVDSCKKDPRKYIQPADELKQESENQALLAEPICSLQSTDKKSVVEIDDNQDD